MLNIFNLRLKHKNISSITSTSADDNLVSKTRHYPPASKEWFNSVYAYNKNTTKLLPSADNYVVKLIRSYFNLYSRKLEKKTKIRRLRINVKKRRLSVNRILVSKPELKHTSDKVLITIYLYNRQKIYYLNKIKKRRLFFFNLGNLIHFKKLVNKKKLIKTNKLNNRRLINNRKLPYNGGKLLNYKKRHLKKRNSRSLRNLRRLRNLRNLKYRNSIKYLKNNLRYLKKKRYFKISKTNKRHLKYLRNLKFSKRHVLEILIKKRRRNLRKFKKKMMFMKKKALNIISMLRKEKDFFSKTLSWNNINFRDFEENYIKLFLKKSLKKEVLYMYYKQLILLNKYKFNNIYLLPLKTLIKKIYKKKVEFNLITLKYFYLNSDIFTQILTLKVRNRRNRTLRVLNSSLRAIKLPSFNKFFILRDMYNRKRKLQKFVVKNLVSTNLHNKNNYNDNLNDVLEKSLAVNIKYQFLNHIKILLIKKNKSLALKKKSIIFINKLLKNTLFNRPLPNTIKKIYRKFCRNVVLHSLNHRVVNGVRIEASGRLTRRNTAARAIFKLRYNGNIKNRDSSSRGFSSVMLRGHFKSNIQYTKLSSKRRIGSFGIKGWINSSN